MQCHGYRLLGKASASDPDYIPSLIGIDRHQLVPSDADVYFERIEVGDIQITSIMVSRWVSYDSLPGDTRDVILGVKAGVSSFYIPLSEFEELIDGQDAHDTRLMLRTLLNATAII